MMPLALETIAEQKELLVAHRRTLAVYLRQQAELGVLTPPGVVNGIAETRADIARIKAGLLACGVLVENEPNDEALPQVEPTQPQRRDGNMLHPVASINIAGCSVDCSVGCSSARWSG